MNKRDSLVFVSRVSTDLKFFIFIIFLLAISSLLIALKKPVIQVYSYVAAMALLIFSINLSVSKITLTEHFLFSFFWFLLRRIKLSEITRIGILPGYGRFFLPGIPGFILTVTCGSLFKSYNIMFMGAKYPHDLTKVFINTALDQNPNIEISNSIISSYGRPPYEINRFIDRKVKLSSKKHESDEIDSEKK